MKAVHDEQPAAPATHGTPAFDEHHPPSSALINTCVHCGFCLPTCPTYVLWGEEMDSPRGRIYLMKAGLEGRTGMAPALVRHFDACLGCMACVTACPSGVQYGPLIEATRGQIERRHQRPLADRLFRSAIFAIFPYPGRLRVALAPLVVLGWIRGRARKRASKARPLAARGGSLATFDGRSIPGGGVAPPSNMPNILSRRALPAGRLAPLGATPDFHHGLPATDARPTPPVPASLVARVRAMIALAPPVTWRSLVATVPERTPALGTRRLTVGLLTGCVARVSFSQVNDATVRVLSAEGCDVVVPAQGCCGALCLHAGRLDEAKTFARRTIEAFERAGVDRVAVNAAGCGSSMKEYAQLLADDPAWAARAREFSSRVRDVTEIISELGAPQAPRHPLPMRVAYHDACHLAHAQGVRQQPRDLLLSIPGIQLLPFAEQEICCGSAGIYNMVEPEPAAQLGDRKVGCIEAVDPDVVSTANPGCTLQMTAAARRRGKDWPILHPIEILDASIRGVDVSEVKAL